MENLPPELFNIGSLALVVVIAIREIFGYLKAKKSNDNYPTKTECDLKHKFLDENLIIIRENHLKHIEEEMRFLRNEITRISTILEERLPPRQNK